MDDFDLELQREIEDYKKSATDIAVETKQNQSFLEKITAPNAPQPFDWSNVAISTGLGATLAVPSGLGIPAGAAAGFVGGVAGETARSLGASDLNTFGAELLGGTVPSLTKTVAKPLIKINSSRAGRAADLIPDNAEQQAIRKAKEKLYGKDTIDVISTTENSDTVQQTLRSQLFPNEIIPEGKTVSTYIRESMYDRIKNLRSNVKVKVTPPESNVVPYGQRAGDTIELEPDSQVFSKSPEFRELVQKDLKALYERDRISRKELTSLHKIVTTDSSKIQSVVDTSTGDIINLIQNGGTFVREGVEQKKIPEEAQKALRERFNQFLERNLGAKEYDKLKEVEKMEMIARARDAIPTILDTKFRYGSNEYDKVLSFIKDSPEGKVDFSKALTQHLSSFNDEVQMKKAFIRLRPAIAESKVLSSDELITLSKKINSFDSTVKGIKRVELLKQTLLAPLIGVVSAEAGSKLDAFKVFTL